MLLPTRFLLRIALFVIGFHWIEIRNVDSVQAYIPNTRVIVSNHVGLFDSFYYFVYHGNCVVVMDNLKKMPIIGDLLKIFQTIFIDRFSKDGKSKAIIKMNERVQDERYPPLLVFPEATTKCMHSLITFKKGAFIAGCNVQPVVIKYPFKHFDQASCPDTNQALLILRLLCQFHTPFSVTYLPVYKPNIEEKKDPQLYANNVR